MKANQNLLNGLKQQLQAVLFKQQNLLLELEKSHLIPEYDQNKPLVLDSKTLPEMKNVLQGEYTKLENFEVVLAVVGTMKAGKSTTINAIVGREILPNRNRPMTSLPTLIAHVKGKKEPTLTCDVIAINNYISILRKVNFEKYIQDERISSYEEILTLIKNIQKNYKFKSQYRGEESIFRFLANLNDLVRLSRIIEEDYPEYHFPFSAYKEINSLPRIEVEFTELAQQEDILGNLVLLDTPGPNEANLPELKEIFSQQLKRSSAVMVVMDYTQLKSQADADIREELEKLPKIEKDRLFALVNKFDQKNANGDDQEITKNIVVNDLLKNKIYAENVYCISAQDAFLATRIKNYIELNNVKPSFNDLEWVQDFAKKAFGTRAKRMWESSECSEVIEDSKALAESSLIELPLKNIIQESYKNAPKIAMQSALRDVDSIFNNIANYFSVRGHFNKEYQMTADDLEKIKKSLIRLENDKKKLKEHVQISLLEVTESVKKHSANIDEKFKILEESTYPFIQHEIEKTVKLFITNKEEQIDNRIGRTKLDKLWKLINSDENYAKDKRELQDELDSLKSAFKDQKIELPKDKMIELSEIIQSKINFLAIECTKSLTEVSKISIENFNGIIKQINDDVITNISEIGQEFGRTGIEIKLTSLEIDFNKMQTNTNLNLSKISDEKQTKRSVQSTSAFAGVKRWFGRKFNNKNWGYETVTVTLLELSLSKLNEEVLDTFSKTIFSPLKSELETYFKAFDRQMKDDLNSITLQIEELINELEAAYEAEQLPYEQKKNRKDLMNDIDDTNKKIELETKKIKEYLPKVLGVAQ